MKIVVVNYFVDKLDSKTEYKPGQVLEWDDKARVEDCINRGLVKAVEAEKVEKPKAEPKKTATKKTATKK